MVLKPGLDSREVHTTLFAMTAHLGALTLESVRWVLEVDGLEMVLVGVATGKVATLVTQLDVRDVSSTLWTRVERTVVLPRAKLGKVALFVADQVVQPFERA